MADNSEKLLVIDKTLNVVFQRKLVHKEAAVYTENMKLNPRCCEILKDVAKQSLRKKIEAMRAEYERADDKSNLQFSQLVKAVERANAQEISATDKFLDKVESTMKCFDTNIGKYQKMYEKIMKNLPQHAVSAIKVSK